MIEILKNIEAIRKEKGIKQEEMGRRLGVTQMAYSNYVNRNLDIPYSRLEQIAKALGVSVVDIVSWPEKYIPESSISPTCEECEKKQITIDNLNKLISVYETKLNNLKNKKE